MAPQRILIMVANSLYLSVVLDLPMPRAGPVFNLLTTQFNQVHVQSLSKVGYLMTQIPPRLHVTVKR